MIGFLRWCFTSGLKGYIVLGIILGILIVAGILIRNAVAEAMAPAPTPPAPTIQPGLPSVSKAPFLVRTASREYYASKAVRNKDDSVTMTDFWEWRFGRWQENKGQLILDKTFGTITISRRKA